MKLVERAVVKDLLEIARADSLQDQTLNNMIEQASEEAEDHCRRKFTKAARVEYFRSYDQDLLEPDPQWIWLDGPVDLTQPFSIVYDPTNNHDQSGLTLDANDYILDANLGLITIKGATGLSRNLALVAFGHNVFAYSATGFQVTYTGGYPVTEKPEAEPVDPMDDYGVVQVPRGLKMIIATKVARDFTEKKMLLPWKDEEKSALKPFEKKDLL